MADSNTGITEEELQLYKAQQAAESESKSESSEDSIAFLRAHGVGVRLLGWQASTVLCGETKRGRACTIACRPLTAASAAPCLVRLAHVAQVEVETPEDRKNAAAKRAATAALKKGDPGTASFQYVCVPADDDKPLTEHTATVHADTRGSCRAVCTMHSAPLVRHSVRHSVRPTCLQPCPCAPLPQTQPPNPKHQTPNPGQGDQLPTLLASSFAGGGMVNMDALRNAMPQAMAGSLGDDKDTAMTPEKVAAQGGHAESFRLSDEVFLYLDEVRA